MTGTFLHLAARAADAAHEAAVIAEARVRLAAWHAERHLGPLVLAWTMLRPRTRTRYTGETR